MRNGKPGRPKSPHKSTPVAISASPKLLRYLDDLEQEEGYGTGRAAVAKTLVWRAIEDLIGKGILDRRKGAADAVETEKP